MSLDYLMSVDLSKKLGKKGIGIRPMAPLEPFPTAPAPVNPLIAPAGPATAPAAASAPVIPSAPAQAAPTIQSQPKAPATMPGGMTEWIQNKQKENDAQAAAGVDLVRIGLQEQAAAEPGPVKSADRPAWMQGIQKIEQKMEHPGEKSSVVRRAVADPLISLVGKGFTGVPQSFVGLADIPTLGRAGKVLEKIGIDFKTTQEIFNSMMSPEAREAQKRVGDAEGFANTIVEAIKNPSTIVGSTLQSLPSMIGGGGIARGLIKKIPGLSPLVAAAIGEGAISAGQNLEDSRKVGGTLTAKQVGVGAASGIATAALGLFGGKAAKWMGIDDVDVLLSGATREAKKGVLLKVLGAIFQEGALEELPQSMQEQIAGNLNAGRPWSDGVLEAGAQGMLAGGLMGGGANIITSLLGGDAAPQAVHAVPVDPNAPPVNPLMAPLPSPAATAQETSSVFNAPLPPVNPLLAQNQPTTNAEDEATVRQAMDSRGEAFAGIRAVEPPPSVATAAVKEVSDKMGVKVIWIDGAPVGGRAIQGAAPEGSNTIFLHTDLLTNPKRDPVMMVYAHELTHRSEKASAKEYGVLRDSVLARAEARASVEEKVASGMSRAAAESEAVAESVEVLGTDQAFWSEVFAGKEQSFIEHIIQIVTDMAERVFGTNQAAKAEQIRGAAVAAFQAYVAQNQQATDSTVSNQATFTENANGFEMATEYLLDDGQNAMLSTGYLLRAYAGLFRRSNSAIKTIIQKYFDEINARNLGDITEFAKSDLYAKIAEEIKAAVVAEYGQSSEIDDIFREIAKNPTGLPRRTGARLRQIRDGIESRADSRGASVRSTSTINQQEAANGVQEEGQAQEVAVVSSKQELPAIKEGNVRVVHLGKRASRDSIVGYGLDYSKQGMLQSMARVEGKSDDIDYSGKGDPRFEGQDAYVFEIPQSEWRFHNDVVKSPGILDKKYLVGIVEGNRFSATPSADAQTTTQAAPATEAVRTPEIERGEKPATEIGVASISKQTRSEVAKLRRKAAQKKRAQAAADEDAKYAEEREARPPPQTRFKSDEPDYKGKPPSSTVWAPGTGLTPIMDEAYARGGIKAKKDKTGGEWDGRRSAYQMRREGDSMFEKPIHGRRRGKSAGVDPDNLSHDMFQHGGMPGELGAERVLKSDQPGALWEQIDEEQKTYRKAMLEAEAEARDDADAKRQNDLWNKHAKTESADSIEVKADDLAVGDSVIVHGERLTVVESSPDGKAVRLEGDKGRYGDAALLWDGDTIYVDEAFIADDGMRERKDIKEERSGVDEDVPFSTKEADGEDSLVDTASMIEDDAEREAFALAELEKRAGVPIVQGPKNLAALSQNHVVATAKDLLERMAAGEIDPVEAMESMEAVEKRVGRTVARAESKAAKEAKMAGESRQQGLPGMEGLAKSPYGTPDDGENGTLFSSKKIEQDSAGEGRERAYSISRYFREELKREWSATYRQKSAQSAYEELEAIRAKNGDDWVVEHIHDLSKEARTEFPLNLRQIAGRAIIKSYERFFRDYGINDDGSNMPNDPIIERVWHVIERLRQEAAAYEKESGQGSAFLAASYSGDMSSPTAVRKGINKLHDKLAAPVIGPVKAPIIEKASGEIKTTYDDAISALEAERAKNAELEENLRVLDEALGKRIGQTEARIKQRSAKSEAYRRGIDEDLAATMAELKAVGMSMEGLSSKPTIEMIQKAVKLYIGIHGADLAKVAAFLKRNLPGETLSPATIKALVNDAQLALDNAGRAAEKAAPKPRKGEAKPRKGATVLDRAPDMTIQPDKLGPQRLFDSGKMWGEGRVLNIGEADAKRLALELTEAGQTVMRGISSNVEVVISNALRHGRNAAGIEKVLLESGIDPDTARRMVKNIVRRRAELVRPALETLRQKYAAKGDKVSRTIASAMDKIMAAMDLADRASTSQVSGFFDGNAWDESRRIIEEAFGFKSEITRDWFNDTMRLYREYEKADEAGNHVLSASLHTDLLNRVAHVQNKGDWWLAARAYIQGGMLSSFRTQEWNLMSTASRAIGFSYVQASRQFIRFAQTGNPKYLAGAYLPFEMLFRSHNQATALFRHIMKTGVNPFVMRVGDEAKFGTDPNTASAAEYMPFFQWKLNRGFKYIGRLLRAADAYFRVGIENSDIVMRSYNSLIKNGQKVPDAIKRSVGLVGFVTDGTNDAYNNASKKADELGLVGFERKMNILIDMRNALDPEYLEKAKLRGAIETFNDPDPEGLVGGLADWARHHSSAPGMFWMGMFARVGANLFNHMQHTAPLWSAMMLAKDTTIGRYKGGESNVRVENKEDIEIRAVRAATSLALATLVVGLCLKSLKDFDDDDEPDETKKKYRFMLTAGGPSDTTLRKNWEKVEKPYTLSVNGHDFSYKWMSGLTAVLAMGGAWMDEKRYGSLKNESIDGRNAGANLDLVLTMSFGMMDAMTSDIPGQALIDFFDVIKTAGKPGSEKMRGMEKWAEKNLASFGSALIPYSRAVIDVDRIVDGESTTARNMAGMKGFFFSTFRDIPYVRNRLLYPYRDIWGEPITYPANANDDMGIVERSARYMLDRFINNTKNDPDIKFLVAAQARIRAPYPNETSIITTEGGKYGLRNMTDKEYDEFLVLFGAELRTQIGLVRELYSSSEQYKKYIRPDNESLKKSISEARSNAMKWAMYKYLTKTGKQISKSKE